MVVQLVPKYPTQGEVPFLEFIFSCRQIELDINELKQCFFGEHLLREKTMPVAIVESEKTAIISSVYLP